MPVMVVAVVVVVVVAVMEVECPSVEDMDMVADHPVVDINPIQVNDILPEQTMYRPEPIA